MRTAALLLAFALPLAACAADTDDYTQDDEAFAADAGGKADAPSFAGLYVTHATHHYNGDVTALELRGDNQYVRERCYHASCALSVPETDTYDTYKSSTGKTYVRFWSFEVGQDSNGERTEEPTVADVYEVQKTSYGVRLRKSYTSRWFALYRATPASTCTGSNGAWDGSDCTCAGNTPGTWPANVFVPGAGGCVPTPGASEDACDTSNGFWTDDDATLIDSYCRCGLDRYDGPTGACVAI
jgi:hypothetical protein